jgi:ribosomal protein S27E
MNLEEFKQYVNEHDDNRIKGDGIADVFRDSNSTFRIVCKKCGSLKIEIYGENGIDYGELTGYSPGENVIKCLECGNAVTVWK